MEQESGHQLSVCAATCPAYLMGHCTGFTWQGFSSGFAARVAFVRSWWKLPLCPMEPVPAGSKMQLLLVKAEPISDGGRASGVT